ncbi:MAG TPA: LLM class flavin-dependent oxidoreductase [Candidatus Dormibacteraeota bacterium]|jgi:probable LLM family oxidoreductase|nr:LLM class flavin-dependent oxidoreductase [Candidatus Dormibacteraeota bacterium]
MELGVYTFAELSPDAAGRIVSPRERLRDLLEEVELADQVGLDVFGLGEHHRPDFAVSAPAVVLAAAAERTTRIRLTSAVSVLSSDDPVRVFQDFATLDLLSGGRAEIMAGRGSFVESFPLFGYDLRDYDDLFAEKLDLLLRLRDSERITWAGTHRASIDDRGVYPRPENRIPIWVAVGGTPQSVVRTGSLGLPMALAIIGGMPERFAPLAELHREAARRAGHQPPALSINSHGFVAETSRAAADEAYPPFATMMNRIGQERGWPPMSRADFEQSRALRGASFVGSPAEVTEKILFQHEIFGHQRFLVQFSVGTLPHRSLMRSIEFFGAEVAPAVRREVARREADGRTAADPKPEARADAGAGPAAAPEETAAAGR